MKQKDLAGMLGVSCAMVSKLVRRGMPTDSLERAQRWRKRHLEPSRVKGSRNNPKAVVTALAGAAAVPGINLAVLIEALNQALMAGQVLPRSPVLLSLRMALRSLPVSRRARHTVAMPVRVWVALIGCVFADSAMAGLHAAEQGETVTAEWVSQSLHSPYLPATAELVTEAACDFYDLDGAAVEEDQGD